MVATFKHKTDKYGIFQRFNARTFCSQLSYNLISYRLHIAFCHDTHEIHTLEQGNRMTLGNSKQFFLFPPFFLEL